MKLSLVPRLRCPVTGEALKLTVIAAETRQRSSAALTRAVQEGLTPADIETVVETGFLIAESGSYIYPVINFIPVLLDFELPLHREFGERYAAQIAAAGNPRMPGGQPRPGEIVTQRAFTVEWSGLGQDAHTFAFSVPAREAHLRAELAWPRHLLDRAGQPPLQVLDVGSGYGLEAVYINNATGGPDSGADVIGLDLNLSMLEAGTQLANLPFVHGVVASLFAPPFAEQSFDLVYSNGVLHHTYCTETAFRSVMRFRKTDGAAYLWVYALEDFFGYTIKGKIQHGLELLLRPIFSQLPGAIQDAVLYPLAWRNMHATRRALQRGPEWTFRNALHATRDLWTPRYSHRHSVHEVTRWFAQAGMETRMPDPLELQKHNPLPLFGIGMAGHARGGP